MSFADFKKNRNKNVQEVINSLNQDDSEGKSGDDRFWKPQVDKAGNGFAVIRFLPPSEGESKPFVHLFDHGFEGPNGKWYIEKSLTTHGRGHADPVSEANSALWNQNKDNECPDKQIARNRKRRLNYYANIMVIRDPANPENEGKVFLYRFGVKVYEKINAKLKPEYEGEKPLIVYDMWDGADFKLKIKKKGGFWNYDDSEFDAPSPLLGGDDEKLEAVWKSQHSLADLVSDDKFKSYDELKKRLIEVLGPDEKAFKLLGWTQGQIDTPEAASAPEPEATPEPAIPSAESLAEDDTPPFDTDDDMDYFSKMAQEG